MVLSTCFRTVGFVCAVLILGSEHASADLVFYTSEAAFDAAAPQLVTQTFASATIPAAGYAVLANPLNSSTNNAVFSIGSIVPGLSIASSVEHANQDLIAVKAGLFGNTAPAIYNNYGGDVLDSSFSSPETAVGMGLLNPNGTSITFTVDSPAGMQLGSQVVTVKSAGASVFFGVIATNGAQIGEVSLLGQPTTGGPTRDFAGIDRLVFGASPSLVPEASSLLLLAAGLTLTIVAVRKRAPIA